MQNRFIFSTPSVTLTDADISGDFNYRHYINPDVDVQLGICAMAELRFTITDFNNISATLKGRSFTWQTMQQDETVYKLMGKFTVDSIKKLRSKTEIIAYDNMIKFDKFVDSWLKELTFPITLANMLTSLCTFCGVTLETTASTITNYDYIIPRTFAASNITGRTILSYICEVAGSFATIGTNGNLNIRYYATNSTSLNNTTYISVLKADYATTPIDKLQIRSTTSDIGVIVGTGTNIYIIENNPLFYATANSQIQTQATNIYNKIRLLSYRPMTIETFSDFNINCGDIITVDGQPTIIMEKTITAAGVKFVSTGNEKRLEQSNRQNQYISRLAGMVHEIDIDIDKLVSRIYDAEGNISTISQTVDTFEMRLQHTEEAVDGIPYTIEAAIIASLTDTTGLIKIFVEGKNYITKAQADGSYLQIVNLNAGIKTYINTAEGKAEVISASSSTYQKISDMNNYVLTNSLNASIGQYIDSSAGTAKIVSAATGTFQKISDMSGYLLSSNLDTRIGQYIDGATGKAKIISAATGTFQTIAGMSGYVQTTTLDTSIGQYIDGTTGRAKIISAVSGTYATISTVSTISQTVSNQGASIALVVGAGKLVNGTTGAVNASVAVSAINGDSSVTINANRISLAGKQINLTSDNITIQSTNFSVNSQGILTAAGANISGKITANDGTIGGWTIGTDRLYSNNNYTGLASVTSSSSTMIWAGGLQNNAPFRVLASGDVYAKNLRIIAGRDGGAVRFYEDLDMWYQCGGIYYNSNNEFYINSANNRNLKIYSDYQMSIDTRSGSSLSSPNNIYIAAQAYTYQSIQLGYLPSYSLLDIRSNIKLYDSTRIYSAGTINFHPETNNPNTGTSRRMYIAGYRILTEADAVFG